MVVVDTLVAKNRSARVRLGVGMCTATFARGAVRDLTKLKVTHAGTLDEPEGWEIREIDMPTWPDGSYMNALVFVTAPFAPGTPTVPDVRRFDIHDEGGGGGGLVHDLSCTDDGAGVDLAYPSMGAPPGTVHELACTDAGTGWDAAIAVADDPATVHELECLDEGVGADAARPTKITPATGKRFEGEIRFEGQHVGETRQVRFSGTIESEVPTPRVEGATAIGKHYPPGLPSGVPASAAGGTITGPTAARYELTTRRERNEWEDGRIHRTYWELQDTAMPYFHQGWLTVGFSDPRTTELTWETGAPVEMHPREFGCEVGVWWTDFNGAARVEQGGLLEKWTLAPPGTRFVEGQSFGVRYGATNIPVAQIPEGLDRESALAQCEFPIWMMSERWEEHGNFSWNGVVPRLTAAWEADHDAARAYVLAQIGSHERPSIPNVFWGHNEIGSTISGEGIANFYGCKRRNRGTGDQADFGVTMATGPAVRLKDPLFLEAIWPHVMQEATCRVMSHRREAPDFKGRGPASPYRAADHPLSWWYGQGPHLPSSQDLLGKLAEPGFESGQEGLTHGHGWHMLFQSHYSANYLTGAYLLTGDPQLKEGIDDLCQQLLSSHHSRTRAPYIDQSRALGRELLLEAQLFRCTNNGDIAALMRDRIVRQLPTFWTGGIFYGQRPVRPCYAKGENSGIQDPVIQPFGEAFVVAGLYAALLVVGDVTNPADPIRVFMDNIGESVVMYQWENTRRNPPNWHIGGLVSYNNGIPVNPTNVGLWHTDINSDYILWAIGCSRLMERFGTDSQWNTGAAIRARAKIVVDRVPPSMGDGGGFGAAGGFGRYYGWAAVLP